MANRSEKVTPTAVKVSALAESIEEAGDPPFDRVFLIAAVSLKGGGRGPVFHIYQSFPRSGNTGIAEVVFDLDEGVVGRPYVKGVEF